jgi:hypothetical protein
MLNEYRARKEPTAPQIVDREAPMWLDVPQEPVHWTDRPGIVAPVLVTFGLVALALTLILGGV